ncbi:hypothetical protein J6590_041051 [Homalodisca vitripennis]|nr:hypothetical protein J6590_041051 [Homalodisca vitripennis]
MTTKNRFESDGSDDSEVEENPLPSRENGPSKKKKPPQQKDNTKNIHLVDKPTWQSVPDDDEDKSLDEDFTPAEEFQEPVVLYDAESSFTDTCFVASPVASTSTNWHSPSAAQAGGRLRIKSLLRKWVDVTVLEMKQFWAILINMGRQKEVSTNSSSKAVKKLTRKLNFNKEDMPNHPHKKQKNYNHF